MPHCLDNPIWNALTSGHANISIGGSLARRYPHLIGPLCGIAEQSPAHYEALAQLLAPDEKVVLFLKDPLDIPDHWQVDINTGLAQMVLESTLPSVEIDDIVPLSDEDIPQMLALAKLTEPGPFRERTLDYGGYVGIKDNNYLVAMAGYRTNPTNSTQAYREISAVCTHPDYQSRGYAKRLMTLLSKKIQAHGETPFLHAWAHNVNALNIYKKMGFTYRPPMTVAVVRPPSERNQT